MDGFWFADEAMQAPSVTNRFFTSWHWLWAFSTDVFGSRPIRAVPISWIVRPGGLSSTNDDTSFAPAAASISAAVTDMSLSSLRSLSLHTQWIRPSRAPRRRKRDRGAEGAEQVSAVHGGPEESAKPRESARRREGVDRPPCRCMFMHPTA